jgi:hypothetical protein
LKKIHLLNWATFILQLFFVYSIEAQEELKPYRTETPPVIDGRLDDITWKNALFVQNFKTFAPDYGKDGTERTTAYAAYDNDNLYFAFYCYDNEPSKIKSSVGNRDNIRSDDWVCINLDSFNDHQSLYAFYVNPLGIQTDSRFSAGQEDFSADYVWYSAGQLVPDGYTIEISIPLKSIRFSEGTPVTMSIFFERYISRFSEHDSYPELDPAKGMAFLTQMSPLVYDELKQSTLFEVLPAFTYSKKYDLDQDHLVKSEDKGEISLTTKYGINSDLILDGTYNPDFSQIEADAGQVDVNLRYALYYPEKRPFFLEGNEIYNLAATQSSVVDPIISLVHTRTIVNPLTGIKLSGKVGSKSTLAAMYAVDEIPQDESAVNGNYAQIPVLRFKQALSGDSYLGGIFTGRELKNSSNNVLGIDGNLRLTKSSTIEWNGLYSISKYAANQDKIGGHALGLNYNYNSRDLSYDFSLKDISENFNAATGFITRTGIFGVTGLIGPKIYPELSSIQRIDLEAFSAQTKDNPSSLWETYNYLSATGFFLGSYNAKIKYSYSTEIFGGEKFKTGGMQIVVGGLISNIISFSVGYKRTDAIYYSDNPFQGYSNQINAVMICQVSDNVESYSSFVFSDFRRKTDSELLYEYPIYRERLTYQHNKYFFIRGVVEYNKFKRQLLTDFLLSFTYIPGTVLYLGYGSLYQKTEWNQYENRYSDSQNFTEINRGFFFKMSYLWRN